MENAVQDPRSAPAVGKDIDPKILAAYKQILTFQFLGTLVLAAVLSVWLLVAHGAAGKCRCWCWSFCSASSAPSSAR